MPEVFFAVSGVGYVSIVPARKTSGAERDFFESAEPMTSQFNPESGLESDWLLTPLVPRVRDLI